MSDSVQRVMDENPGATDEEIARAFAYEVEADNDLTRACLKIYSADLLASLRPAKRRGMS